MTPSLATVPGKLLTMLFVTHHSDALAPKQRHLLEPAHLVHPQPRQDGGKTNWDMAPFVHSDGATCPVHQHQVIRKGIWLHIPVENEHLFRFKMNADSGLRVHRFRTPQCTYSDVR